jgi:hypothetical protein
MKVLKRGVFCLLSTAVLLLSNNLLVSAQTAAVDTSDQKLQEERQIAWNIFRLVGGISNHFADFKGDSITTDGGIAAYQVKGLLNMHADNDYIMVKQNGDAYYVAVVTGDELKLKLYYLAFNYGIDEYAEDNKIKLLAKPVPEMSNDEKDVYALMINNTKVGSLTREKNNMRERIIIGFVK